MSSSFGRAGVVALRVIRQLKRDRRTIGLIVFAPIVLMILFGYALSGEMSGVALGLVDGGGQAGLKAHLESIPDYDILRLGSESDAEKLVSEGRLDGAVVLEPEGVRVLLDASSLQISGAIAEAVQAWVAGEQTSGLKDRGKGITMRYISAIAFIRERSQGTLEKFMVSPLSRVEMVAGYVLGFSLFTILQSATTLFVVTFGFGVPMKGSALTALSVVLLLGAGALVLGSFFSNFAKSEFQVVQFIPLIITPQIVLCGIWWPLQSVPEFIRPFSYILPLTYAADALRAVMLKGSGFADILYPDLLALAAFFAIFFAAATVMLRREVG
ncbi:MAG: antibiotic transport system permease protein [Methanosaeta sp. NSM2]|nr:ABC transporter permease [Methanothrix sp.]OYV14742.1 MAG: antibiotic transport system permease protein [Methanosaeta sp. NSM2]